MHAVLRELAGQGSNQGPRSDPAKPPLCIVNADNVAYPHERNGKGK